MKLCAKHGMAWEWDYVKHGMGWEWGYVKKMGWLANGAMSIMGWPGKGATVIWTEHHLMKATLLQCCLVQDHLAGLGHKEAIKKMSKCNFPKMY